MEGQPQTIRSRTNTHPLGSIEQEKVAQPF